MKAIYTPPIKALSNKKHNHSRKIFQHVGLAAGLIFIKSPHYSQATYVTFQC